MTPFGILFIFLVLLFSGIITISAGAWAAAAVFLFTALVMGIVIIKDIIDANDQSDKM